MAAVADIALINNSQTPYRLAFHRRLARELEGRAIHSVFTHDVSSFAWTIDNPEEINPIVFGPGEPAINQSRPSFALHELEKAGRIIEWMQATGIRAVVLGGYNDPGYLRIMRWCRRNHVPCLLFGDSNIRDDAVTGWRRTVKNALLAYVIRSCAAFLACGSLGRAYYERYGAPADKIFYTPYEPDYALIQQVSPALLDDVYRGRGLAPRKKADRIQRPADSGQASGPVDCRFFRDCRGTAGMGPPDHWRRAAATGIGIACAESTHKPRDLDRLSCRPARNQCPVSAIRRLGVAQPEGALGLGRQRGSRRRHGHRVQ